MNYIHFSMKSKKERLKFDGHLDISAIERIEAYKQREFHVAVRNAHRVHVKGKGGKKQIALHVDKETTYAFRCKTTDIRDQWVLQLNKSMDASVKNVLLELYEGS